MTRAAVWLASAWKTIVRRDALERELDDELRATIDTLADRYVDEGMTREAAEREALAELGGQRGLMQVREDVRDTRIGAGIESLLLDARYAWRGLCNTRGVTTVIAITLALGIGANTAIFSIVHTLLIEPLPYRDSDRLAFIWLDRADVGYPRGPLSAPDFQDVRTQAATFADIAGIWASGTAALTDGGPLEELRSAWVTTNFFDVLGAQPALGRTFTTTDAAPDAPASMLIGWDLFERRFGADPSIVGRRIQVSGVATTVIGVMPRRFRLLLPQDSSVPDRLQVWRPFWPGFEESPRGHLFMRVVGRMRPEVTITEAATDVARVADAITQRTGNSRAFTTVALHADAVRDVRGAVMALFAGVAILLTIACVNVASLLVARASAHARETALRLTLGAGRIRILRQCLIEGLILTLLGAAIGTIVGVAILRVLVALAPASLDRIGTARIDGTVLAFTAGISLAWGLLFSLAPAAQLFRSASSAKRMRTRSTLVVVQVAMSVVLLIGAGLLARAFVAVQHVDPGFRADGRLTLKVALSEQRYATTNAVVAGLRDLQRRLATIPGVTSAGAVSHLPFDDLPNWYLTYGLEKSWTDNGVAKADARAISGDLFETLGVTLVDGRFFTDDKLALSEVEGDGAVGVVVDEMLARDLWPGQRAVGRRFMIGQGSPDQDVTVVGVIRHLRLRSLVEELTPQIFIPYAAWIRTPMAFVLATDADPAALVPNVHATVAAFDAALPAFDVRPMQDYLASARSAQRFTTFLAVAFASCALVLTCVGVYGVLAYSVATRRVEIGVRRALGADAIDVMRSVLGEGLALATLGSVVGLIVASLIAWLGARLVEGQLYAVHPLDPVTYACAVAAIVCGSSLACFVPALRASAISPADLSRNK